MMISSKDGNEVAHMHAVLFGAGYDVDHITFDPETELHAFTASVPEPW